MEVRLARFYIQLGRIEQAGGAEQERDGGGTQSVAELEAGKKKSTK